MLNKNNINHLMQQAQKMQEKMKDIQKKISVMQVTGEAGAGLVKITMNGEYICIKIKIDTILLKPKEKEMIEDLTIAAFNDAIKKINEKKKQMYNFSSETPLSNVMNPFI